MAGLIVGWPKGDGPPIPVFLGFVVAFIVAFSLGRSTIFTSLDRLASGKRALIGLLAFDFFFYLWGLLARL